LRWENEVISVFGGAAFISVFVLFLYRNWERKMAEAA
jgi:hypothetical protein